MELACTSNSSDGEPPLFTGRACSSLASSPLHPG
eukprot:CAMPEP_0117594474 /NCGR_PEP_ID=MMETSP0784-20121206/73221_1 /TAXON_ID=39447 /ORGANISM="" /LENGTH=33 /DNA_ID= /DNA_START= /DNA_END= /DNA_ORIENTATION=